MLGLGRASQYAGWWNTGGPIKIDIPVATTVSQAAYQTPVFTWRIPTPEPGNQGPIWRPAYTGYVNVSGYDSLTNYNYKRCTMVHTFQMPWTSGLSAGYYNAPRYGININGTGYDVGLQLQIGSAGNLIVNYGNFFGEGGPSATPVTLPGAYTNYTAAWLTVVFSQAETSSAFTDWTGTGSSTSYNRLAVYNTQTGALIGKKDTATPIGTWPDITTLITASSGQVLLNTGGGSGNYSLGWDSTNTDDTYPFTHAQDWISLGTMWDPLTVKSTDSTWLTTRPNNTIGTGVAWVNQQWTTYENPNSSTWYLTDTAGDLVTGATNNRQNSFVAAGNSTIFSNNYSTTNIPKDTS